MDDEERRRKNWKQLGVGFTLMILVISTAVAASLGIEQMFTGLITSVSNILASIGLPGIPAIPALGTLVATFIAVALWDAVKATARNRDKIKNSLVGDEIQAEEDVRRVEADVEELLRALKEDDDINLDTAQKLDEEAEEIKEQAVAEEKEISTIGLPEDPDDAEVKFAKQAMNAAEQAEDPSKVSQQLHNIDVSQLSEDIDGAFNKQNLLSQLAGDALAELRYRREKYLKEVIPVEKMEIEEIEDQAQEYKQLESNLYKNPSDEEAVEGISGIVEEVSAADQEMIEAVEELEEHVSHIKIAEKGLQRLEDELSN